jgi:metal-dependent hydrolase (beta-lactamase superfamily II)
MDMDTKKKYLLVTEHPHHEGGKGLPFLLEVIRETSTTYVTPEVFSVNLRDLSPLSMRKKEVRWAKFAGKRSGDNDAQPLFKVRKILNQFDPAVAATAMVITAK